MNLFKRKLSRKKFQEYLYNEYSDMENRVIKDGIYISKDEFLELNDKIEWANLFLIPVLTPHYIGIVNNNDPSRHIFYTDVNRELLERFKYAFEELTFKYLNNDILK